MYIISKSTTVGNDFTLHLNWKIKDYFIFFNRSKIIGTYLGNDMKIILSINNITEFLKTKFTFILNLCGNILGIIVYLA